MNYSKPEVKTLGPAKVVIEQTSKTIVSTVDPPSRFKKQNPACDLDE